MRKKYHLFYTLNKELNTTPISNQEYNNLSRKIEKLDIKEQEVLILLIYEYYLFSNNIEDISNEEAPHLPYSIKSSKKKGVQINICKLPDKLIHIIQKFLCVVVEEYQIKK